MNEIANFKITKNTDENLPTVTAVRRLICLSNGNIAALLLKGVAILNPNTTEEIAFLDGGKQWVFAIAEISNNRIAMAGSGKIILIYDLVSLKLERTIYCEDHYNIYHMASANGILACGTANGIVFLWDVNESKSVRKGMHVMSWDAITAVTFKGNVLSYASQNRKFSTMNIESLVVENIEYRDYYINAIEKLSDTRLLCGFEHGETGIYDEERHTTTQWLDLKSRVVSIRVISDGKIVYATINGLLSVFEADNKTKIHEIVAFPPNKLVSMDTFKNDTVVVCSEDNVVKIYKI